MKKERQWYKKASNWIMIIACIILVPILLANVWIMIQSNTNKEEVPSIFGFKPFIVLSGSMETKIHKGDLIITKNVDPEELKVNDVIAYRDQAGTVTTHRIIDIIEEGGETYFITKGDNNSTQDQNLVEFSDVEGIYVTRIPNIGNIMNSLSEPTTIVVLVLGITVIFIICFAISTKKMEAKEKQEFLEYKRQKELEEKKKKEAEIDEAAKKEVKKAAPKKKAVEKNSKKKS